jgi:hypothetical protein
VHPWGYANVANLGPKLAAAVRTAGLVGGGGGSGATYLMLDDDSLKLVAVGIS